MVSQLKTAVFAILVFIMTPLNLFSGGILIDGQFTYPPPRMESDEEIVINLPEKNETITIASFNIQVFDKTKAGQPEVMRILAKTITDFDIVAIQEIRDSSGIAIRKLEHAVDALGTEYEFIIGPHPGRTLSGEQYAYMYNSETVSVGESYIFDDAGSDHFHREPFIAGFKAKNGNFDFVLITIHTDPDAAAREINAIPIAVKDAQKHFPDEKDFIILWGLNATSNYFAKNDPTVPMRSAEFMWRITNEADTNLARLLSTYDRIILTTATTAEDYAGKSGVFRLDKKFNLDLIQAKRISRHFPVYGLFYVDKDTD